MPRVSRSYKIFKSKKAKRRKMLDIVLELIYPNVCGICGKICKENLCKKCKNKIKEYEINLHIKNANKNFVESMHIFKYKGIIREKILEYKFNNKPYLYKTFTKIILNNEKTCRFFKRYDIIIPVPIHKKRNLKRGYNQTELIAKEIAKNTDLKLVLDVLFKQKDIRSQSELNKIDRENNVKEAFIVKNNKELINKRILLFDDIYTTGSTVNECSKILKNAGANKIGILTLAKD